MVWDEADTLVNINSYVYSLKIDSATATQLVATCAVVSTNVHCTSPIILSSGSHTIVLTATNGAGSASATLNYVPGTLPTTPVNLGITITITVP